jgi:hypothetical protein
MDTLRNLLQTHGAARTKQLLDEAIAEERRQLESRLTEINAYLNQEPHQQPQQQPPTSQSSIVSLEAEATLSPKDKPKRVKPTPNSNRVHPIARAKANRAEPKPKAAAEPSNPSETDGKPARGVLKAEQRKKEAAKRKELEEQGIVPSSLLTKENLSQWLAAGKTYSQIAREEVGMREEDVSAAAKKHGLSSQKTHRLTGKENVLVTKEPAAAGNSDA